MESEFTVNFVGIIHNDTGDINLTGDDCDKAVALIAEKMRGIVVEVAGHTITISDPVVK